MSFLCVNMTFWMSEKQFSCSYVYRKLAQNCMDIIKNIQGSRDINKSLEKYYDLGQSKIKDIYLDKNQKIYSLFIKDLWTIEVQNIRNIPLRISS